MLALNRQPSVDLGVVQRERPEQGVVPPLFCLESAPVDLGLEIDPVRKMPHIGESALGSPSLTFGVHLSRS